ncbi:MAG: hypothetical protein Ct9H300mP8_03800 [Gammaproteobacteria bacterium]|nr:MAG: hypothetical protein Ct9H300mP8_03800 [Gammaproteobacteria bacterium]
MEFKVDGRRAFIDGSKRYLIVGSSRAQCLRPVALPVRNEKVFEQGFPAEFIAEGLDQTGGGFIPDGLAAALYEKPAFRNVIVNGMVMAEDGKKMSKANKITRLPGVSWRRTAPSFRLYLINSGLFEAKNNVFGVAGSGYGSRALLPWYNAFAFLQTYASIDHWTPDKGDYIGSNILTNGSFPNCRL